MTALLVSRAVAMQRSAQPHRSLRVVAAGVRRTPPCAPRRTRRHDEFDVDGLHVILRRNTANDVVAANLYLLGGTQQLTPQTAGIEALLLWRVGARNEALLRAMRSARQTARARQHDRRSSRTTTGRCSASRGMRDTFDSTWAILADRADGADARAGGRGVRARAVLAGVRQRNDRPTTLVQQLADSLLYRRSSVRAPADRRRALALVDHARRSCRKYQRDADGDVAHAARGRGQHRPRAARAARARHDRARCRAATTSGRRRRSDLAARPTSSFAQRRCRRITCSGYYAGPAATSPDYRRCGSRRRCCRGACSPRFARAAI